MVAPVAAFTVIPLADVDPDSPVATDLMNALRLNDQNLFAQLVGDPVATPPFTPAAAHDHDGVNSKAVAGANLRFIAATEVAGAPVASVTFAGLDGNVDGHYVLFGSVVPSVVFTDLQLRFNALATNYDNTDDASASGIVISPGVGFTTEHVKFQMQIYAKNLLGATNAYPSALAESHNIVFTTITRFENAGARSGDVLPEPNVTSLVIATATGGTPIGIGSRFALYKLAEN